MRYAPSPSVQSVSEVCYALPSRVTVTLRSPLLPETVAMIDTPSGAKARPLISSPLASSSAASFVPLSA